MSGRARIAFFAIAACCSFASTSPAAMVDFESVRPGTSWGVESGQVPGDPILSEAGIPVSVETFLFGDALSDFFRAEVPDAAGRFERAFPTQELSLDSINVLFDFTALRFDVDFVSFEFVDFGGTSNLAVNGSTVYIVDPLVSAPIDIAPGITATFSKDSRITLTADAGTRIETMLVGGQELVIDNVMAVPEPTTVLLMLVGAALLLRCRRPART